MSYENFRDDVMKSVTLMKKKLSSRKFFTKKIFLIDKKNIFDRKKIFLTQKIFFLDNFLKFFVILSKNFSEKTFFHITLQKNFVKRA